jgi:hypothetical protein
VSGHSLVLLSPGLCLEGYHRNIVEDLYRVVLGPFQKVALSHRQVRAKAMRCCELKSFGESCAGTPGIAGYLSGGHLKQDISLYKAKRFGLMRD